jgi:bifunctional non-homologous end joining protein LigD
MTDKKLGRYLKKRDFSISPEPKGKKTSNKTSMSRFVVQKHAASHLHYDFRLEIEGVLKSWAVPKGPSLNPEDKRLAIETEDHPIEYQKFEGIIPEKQYGAGKVLIWDKGTYKLVDKEFSLLEAYKKGHLKISLKGKKLKGAFTLQRIKEEDHPQWLLFKLEDKYADKKHSIIKDEKSVISEKILKEIDHDE